MITRRAGPSEKEEEPSDSNHDAERAFKKKRLNNYSVDKHTIDKEADTAAVVLYSQPPQLQQAQKPQQPQTQPQPTHTNLLALFHKRVIDFINAGAIKGANAFHNDEKLKNYFLHLLLHEYEFLNGEKKLKDEPVDVKPEQRNVRLEDYNERNQSATPPSRNDTDSTKGIHKDEVEAEDKEEDEELHGSYIGTTFWAPKEKELLFTALERCGKRNIDEICQRVGKTKTRIEVAEYLTLLDSLSQQCPRITCRSSNQSLESQYAKEMSNEFVQHEEEAAQKLEEKLEVEAYTTGIEQYGYDVQQRLIPTSVNCGDESRASRNVEVSSNSNEDTEADDASNRNDTDNAFNTEEEDEASDSLDPLSLWSVPLLKKLFHKCANNYINTEMTLLTATIPLFQLLLKSFLREVIHDVHIELMSRRLREPHKDTLVTDTMVKYVLNRKIMSGKDRRFKDLNIKGAAIPKYDSSIEEEDALKDTQDNANDVVTDADLEATDIEALELYAKDELLENKLRDLDKSYESALAKELGFSYVMAATAIPSESETTETFDNLHYIQSSLKDT